MKTTELENKMKFFRLSALIALILLFCLGLHTAGQAQTPTTTSYTAVVSTPSGPSDPPAGPGFQYFGSTATLKVSGQQGELTASNLRYKWTAKMTQWQSGSGFTGSNAPTAFLDASSPPKDTSTANPTTLRTVFSSSGYYQLTLSVTITYDMVDSKGNGQTNIPASGSATCQIEVAVPDFSMSGGNSLTIPLDSSAPITVTASPINNFYGTIQLSLTAGSPNAGQSANPSGVTLGSGSSDPSLSISLFSTQGNYPITASNGSSSTTTTVNVAGSATPAPGGTPFVVYGDGSDNGPSIEHSTTFTLTIPKRHAEITCPPYDPSNMQTATVPNNRATDGSGSISVDAAASWTAGLPPASSGWYGRGGLSTQNEQGFTSLKTYAWTPTFGGTNADTSGSTYGGVNGNTFFLDDELATSLQTTVTLGKSDNIQVAIKNSPGSLPYTTSYTIKWHYPYENWKRHFLPGPGGSTDGSMLDTPPCEMYTGSGFVVSGLPVNVTANIPTSSISDSLGIVGSTVLGVTGTGVGTTGGADFFSLTTPESAIGASLLVAASYVVAATVPVARGPIIYPTGVNNFQDSVTIQKFLNTHPGANYLNGTQPGPPILDPDSQRVDPGTANLITLTTTVPSATYYYGNVWAGSLGPMQVQVVPGRYRWVVPYYGDQYGSQGYIRSVQTNLRYPGGYQVVYQWKIGSFVPGPIKL